MATKKRPKKQTEKKTPAAIEPVDGVALEKLQVELERRCERYYGYRGDIEKQYGVIADLEAQLMVEREKLRRLSLPLQHLKQYLDSPAFKRAAEWTPHDIALRRLTNRLSLKESKYVKNRWTQVSTGAVPWADLAKRGATDAEILANLKHVQSIYDASDYRFDKEKLELTMDVDVQVDEPDADMQGKARVLHGKDEIVAALRRVYEIGEPGAAATVAKKSAGTKKSSKPTKKPGKSKPAGRTKKPAAKKKSSTDGRTVEAKASAKRKGKRSKREVSKAVAEMLQGNNVAINQAHDRVVLSALKKTGKPMSGSEVHGQVPNAELADIWASLDRLVDAGHAAIANGKWSYVEKPAASTPAANGKQAAAAAPAMKDAVDVVRELGGSATAKTVALQLGLTTDAAGALLRRRAAKGLLKKTDDGRFELPGGTIEANGGPVPSPQSPDPADIDGALDLSDDDVDENGDDPSGQYQPAGGGTAVATARAKKNRVFKRPESSAPLFGAKPR